jgi:hypothetical protein
MDRAKGIIPPPHKINGCLAEDDEHREPSLEKRDPP